MSWSRSTTGRPMSVIKDINAWVHQQEMYDMNIDAAVRDGHAAQITSAVKAITIVCEALDANHMMVVAAHGHHDGRLESSQSSVRIEYSIPVAMPRASA